MYSVPKAPLPRGWRFVASCTAYGMAWGALCGLIWGALSFVIVGALGVPIGVVFGTNVGALDGLVCGVVLHRWGGLFDPAGGEREVGGREALLKWAITLLSIVMVVSISIVFYLGLLAERPRFTLENEVMWVLVVLSLIAGGCGYVGTGRRLHWYRQHCLNRG